MHECHSGPITVGYERTVYTTTEGDGSVTLCAIVTEPATGGAPRPFIIAATTSDDTASEEFALCLHIVVHSPAILYNSCRLGL